jgi:pyruvate-formate lyase-activating enzyme
MDCKLIEQGFEQGSCQVFELAAMDAEIPFTILAFFPAYKMSDVPPPDLWQMIDHYTAATDAGLRKIKFGNVHLFVNTREEYETLEKIVGRKNGKS